MAGKRINFHEGQKTKKRSWMFEGLLWNDTRHHICFPTCGFYSSPDMFLVCVIMRSNHWELHQVFMSVRQNTWNSSFTGKLFELKTNKQKKNKQDQNSLVCSLSSMPAGLSQALLKEVKQSGNGSASFLTVLFLSDACSVGLGWGQVVLWKQKIPLKQFFCGMSQSNLRSLQH